MYAERTSAYASLESDAAQLGESKRNTEAKANDSSRIHQPNTDANNATKVAFGQRARFAEYGAYSPVVQLCSQGSVDMPNLPTNFDAILRYVGLVQTS